MSTSVALAQNDEIDYPDRDGKPMADNTKQFRWIQTIEGNLEGLFRERQDVFIAGDNLWYPVQEHPEVRQAPDVYVVFGRPKGDRGSYKQWAEAGVPLTVVFEIISPGNTVLEMDEKFEFYDEYGVEEYYIYDPDHNRLAGYVRRGDVFRRVRPIHGHVSPRLGIRFDLSGEEMVVYHPSGKRFLTFEELVAEREKESRRADRAEQRAERLAQLTRKVLAGQLTPEEREELDRLLAP